MNAVRITAKIALASVFLVVIAGSIVRMTGSGMGCPDWPKCFGYYIPPTDISTLTWHPDRSFKKGQIIIKEEALWVANTDFTTAENFNPSNWSPYTKHNYAVFNPVHTWTEYINRLTGAFSGIPVLLLCIFAFAKFKRDPLTALLSLLVVFMLGFEAWLGKVVVDGHLIPHQITYHMMGAFLLIGLLVIIIKRVSPAEFNYSPAATNKIFILLSVTILLSLFQIVLGTQVREEIDLLNKSGVVERSGWIDNLSNLFLVHRSFSIILVATHALLLYYLKKAGSLSPAAKALGFILLMEIFTGVFLNYLGMPKLMQPLHLFLATLIFALQIWLLISIKRAKLEQNPFTYPSRKNFPSGSQYPL